MIKPAHATPSYRKERGEGNTLNTKQNRHFRKCFRANNLDCSNILQGKQRDGEGTCILKKTKNDILFIGTYRPCLGPNSVELFLKAHFLHL